MNKIRYLLESRTPDEYIKRSLKVKISRGVKASVTHNWLLITGFTIKDVAQARYKNVYWRAKRLKGNNERNFIRIKNHNYSKGSRSSWNELLIIQFIKMNSKLTDDSYSIPDFILAQHFQTTIPSIQYMRRKLNIVHKIAEKNSLINILSLMKKSEQKIKSILLLT